MENNFDINLEISAGKKDFTVSTENDLFNLTESGSLVAVIRKESGKWELLKGSYSEEDAQLIGKEIERHL